MSINTKLRHYKTVILPEVLYASETLFGPTRLGEKDKMKKVERQIIRNCIGKWSLGDGGFYIVPNKQIYETIEPLTSIIRKKRISFLGHIFGMEDTRLLRKLLEFCWNKQVTPNSIKDVKKDIEELNITIADLKTKLGNYKTLKQPSVKFKEQIQLRETMVISDA